MFVIFEVILGDRYERNLYVNVALYGNTVSFIHACLYIKPSKFCIAVQRMMDDTAVYSGHHLFRKLLSDLLSVKIALF